MSVSPDSPIVQTASAVRDRPVRGPRESSGLAAPRIEPTDGELLTLFTRRQDRAALDRLIDRHAAMVWRVCRQALRRPQDAEDAFQATFLLLIKSARSINSSESAAGWLYRVAYRTSIRARKKLAARREESLAVDPDAPSEAAFPDLLRKQTTGVLVEELMRLPAKYQTPLVLRYLEGQSRRAIADQTDTTVAAVQGRLARGKQMLRRQLLRRGVSLSAAMAALGLAGRGAQAAETAPAHVVAQTTSNGVALATGGSLAASAAVVSLYQEGVRAMLLMWIAKPAGVAASIAAVALLAMTPGTEGDAPNPVPIATLQLTVDLPNERVPLAPEVILAQADTPAAGPAVANLQRESSEEPSVNSIPTGVVFTPGPALSRMEYGDMGRNGRKLTDAEQSEFLRKLWVERAAADPPPADGQASLKELQVWHTYWEHRYGALKRRFETMSANASVREQAAESELAASEVWKARAEMLRYERELKARALASMPSARRTTSLREPTPRDGTVLTNWPSGKPRTEQEYRGGRLVAAIEYAEDGEVLKEYADKAKSAAAVLRSPTVTAQLGDTGLTTMTAPDGTVITATTTPQPDGSAQLNVTMRDGSATASRRRQSLEESPEDTPATGVGGSPPRRASEPTLAAQDRLEIVVWGGEPEHGFAGSVSLDWQGAVSFANPMAKEQGPLGSIRIGGVGGKNLSEAAKLIAARVRQATGDPNLRIRVSHPSFGVAGNEPPQMTRASLVETVPARDAIDVDPNLREVRVTFDRDMSPYGYSFSGMPKPRDGRKPKWVDKRTCVLPVELRPGQTYGVGINADGRTSFKSAEGTPAAYAELRFTTAAASDQYGADSEMKQGQWNCLHRITELNPAGWATVADLKVGEHAPIKLPGDKRPRPHVRLEAVDEDAARFTIVDAGHPEDGQEWNTTGPRSIRGVPVETHRLAAGERQGSHLLVIREVPTDDEGNPEPLAAAPTVEAAKQSLYENRRAREESELRSKILNLLSHIQGVEVEVAITINGATVKEAAASIAVPISYIEAVRQDEQATAESAEAKEWEAIRREVKVQVEQLVQPLLPRLPLGENEYRQVRVVFFQDVSASRRRESSVGPANETPSTDVEGSPDDQELAALNAQAWRHFFGNEQAKAEELFRRVLAVDADHLAACNGLGFCLINRGEHEKALPLFEKCVAANPDATGPLNGLGRTLEAAGDLDSAIAAWERSVAAMPNTQLGAAHMALGRVYSEQGEWEKALPLLERITAEQPGNEPYAEWLKTAKRKLNPEPPKPLTSEGVYVVGTYSGADGAPLTVEVPATEEPITLVMCAYYWQDWKLKLDPDAKLERVIVAGYNGQRLDGVIEALPEGVPLDVFSYYETKLARNDTPRPVSFKDREYFYAYKKTSEEYYELADKVRELTGKEIAHFQGATRAKSFVVGRD